MTINSLKNGQPINSIELCDRGFHYGDGLFETVAFKKGRLLLWKEHLSRLSLGCKKIGLPEIPEKKWIQDIKQLIINSENAVVKLMLTRGCGGRGYLNPQQIEPTRIVSVYPWPNYPDDKINKGVNVIFCKTPASVNSALAGLKHLNKLENVIARNEWNDVSISEGLMLDSNDNVIEGTMSNVFSISNGLIYTPILKHAGVNGVVREHVIEVAKRLGLTVQQVEIKKEKLLEMDELFLTNSLIGVWPIKKLADKDFKKGQMTQKIVESLNMEENSREL